MERYHILTSVAISICAGLSVLVPVALGDNGDGRYLLITGEALKDSFQPLVDHRVAQGLDGILITIEEIAASGEYSGIDIQAKIRDCIQRHYDPNRSMYLVLGGDEHIVPVRYCQTEDETVPVDLYYADMDGTLWDADGDGIYGEIGDIGLAELTPELCFGRIPVDTPEEVEAYYSKMIRYETIDPNEFVDSLLLLSGSGYEFCYEGPERPAAYRDHEPVSQKEVEMTDVFLNIIQPYWQPGHLARLFDSNTDWDVNQFGDFPITWVNVFDTINRGYHYIYYWQHSGTRYWTFQDEDTGCVFNWVHGSNVTNTFPSIMFARGCSTARYDEDDTNLCESLIKNGNGGAIIYFGHTRSAGGSPHWDQILRNVFQESHPRIGEAYKACLTILAPEKISNPWHQYIFVLLGDPAIVCHQQQKRTLQLLSPKGNEISQAGSDLFIRWNGAGSFSPQDQVTLSYSDDDGLHWYSIPGADHLPYNAAVFTWENCPLPCGSGYRVRVSSLSNPELQVESSQSFRIADMVELTIKSKPMSAVKVTGAHCYQTDCILSVIAGEPVQLTAPEHWGDLTFIRWIADDGSTFSSDSELNQSFGVNITLTATYEYHGDIAGFFVNDEIAEDGMAAGNDSQDGRSSTTPMRSVQALLDRYPDIGYGDIVHVSEGRYIENLFLSQTHVGLTLRGAGPTQSIIDGGHVTSCLLADNGWCGELQNLGFENGLGTTHGGALQLGGGAACIVRNCRFVGNEAQNRGGAIYLSCSIWPMGLEVYDSIFLNNRGNQGIVFTAKDVMATFQNCTFQGNTSNNGCVKVTGSTQLIFTDCLFENNVTLGSGGAIQMSAEGVSHANHCTFTANSAKQGGAVEADTAARFTAEDCIFQGNTAPEGGGAVHFFGSATGQFRRCTFKNNTGYQGGGVYCRDQSRVEADHCLFTGNVVSQAGGAVGIYNDAVFTATNCTIADNSCGNLSGGIAWHSWGDLTLNNCILFNNPAPKYPDLRLSGNGTAMVSFCCTPDLRDGIGNITDDPLFVDAEASDYHLKSQAGRWDSNLGRWLVDDVTSPCIDAGDPATDWKEEFWPHGGRTNIGFYGGTSEASMSQSPVGNVADLNLNHSVDIADLMLLADQWIQELHLLRADLDRNGRIDLKDLTMMSLYWLEVLGL